MNIELGSGIFVGASLLAMLLQKADRQQAGSYREVWHVDAL